MDQFSLLGNRLRNKFVDPATARSSHIQLFESQTALCGAFQHKDERRYAYIRTATQKQGLGAHLLSHLLKLSTNKEGSAGWQTTSFNRAI
jgi:hypothetical protein